MASVCVLVPNGRRQTVKCTPNTTLLQILEDVCKKHDLKPEEHDLKHHNKVLDSTATFRFSGLPNNAQLELVDAVKVREVSDVTLALSLEDGTRPTGQFHPSESLLDVLKKLNPESAESDKHPVIIYTRREIYGDALQQTTLKSLGLTGGRAMLRLIHRHPEELKTQANVSAPIPSKPVEEKPYRRTFQKLDDDVNPTTKTEESLEDKNAVTDSDNHKTQKNNVDDTSNKKTTHLSGRPAQIQPKHNTDLLKLAKEKRKLEFKPAEPTKCDIKKTYTDTHQKEESMEVDETAGGASGSGGNHARNMQTTAHNVNVDEEFAFIGARNAMIFSLESAQSVPTEDLPDDFFELTIDDARRILRDIKRKRDELETGGPLMTSALRNLEESKKQLRHLNRYKKAIIRVQFPNRTILQGVFQPSDTVGDVIKFVREYLEDKSLKFYLYTTPPKDVLDQESKLIEINCVPGALVHFGTDPLDTNGQYLRKDLQDKFTTNSVASLAATVVRQQSRRTDTSTEDDNAECSEAMDVEPSTSQPVADTSSATPSTSNCGATRKIVKSTEKVPKWFKPTK